MTGTPIKKNRNPKLAHTRSGTLLASAAHPAGAALRLVQARVCVCGLEGPLLCTNCQMSWNGVVLFVCATLATRIAYNMFWG